MKPALFSIKLTGGQWVCNVVSSAGKPRGFVRGYKASACRFVSIQAAHAEATFQGLKFTDYSVHENPD